MAPDTHAIRRAVTTSPDPATAAQELYDGLYSEDAALSVFFCTSKYDLDALARELHARFGDAPLIGLYVRR